MASKKLPPNKPFPAPPFGKGKAAPPVTPAVPSKPPKSPR